jgi:transposase
LLNRFSNKVSPIYDLIKQRVSQSSLIGVDETGIKVNDDNHWFWAWQTPKLTFTAHAPNRKAESITALFPKGFPNSTLVHDGWKPQLNTPAKNHQTCFAHLQRHLIYLNKVYPDSTRGNSFLKLLYQSLELTPKPKQKDYCIERTKIIQALEDSLINLPDKNHKKLQTFYRHISRERQQLFIFIFIEKVPPDNNALERAIRNVKVKQKISGQFKTEQTAQNFAKIRSVIDTTINNEMNVLESLTLIAKVEFQLYKEGLNLLEIAEKRRLSSTTIYSHLSQLYTEGKQVELEKHVTKEIVDKVRIAFNQLGRKVELKPMYEN